MLPVGIWLVWLSSLELLKTVRADAGETSLLALSSLHLADAWLASQEAELSQWPRAITCLPAFWDKTNMVSPWLQGQGGPCRPRGSGFFKCRCSPLLCPYLPFLCQGFSACVLVSLMLSLGTICAFCISSGVGSIEWSMSWMDETRENSNLLCCIDTKEATWASFECVDGNVRAVFHYFPRCSLRNV